VDVDARRILLHAAHAVERAVDAAKAWLGARWGRPDRPVLVLPFRGFGDGRRLLLGGRVLLDHGIGTQGPADPLWKNLVNTWRRFESDEVAGARLEAAHEGCHATATSDEEGYFRFALEVPPGAAGGGWRQVAVELVELPPRLAGRPLAAGGRATGRVLVPSPGARFGVVSDLDDTVVETGVTSKLVLARNVFLRNAHTRLPFPGVGAFYRALARAAPGDAENPFFYVSASPWNLYDLVAEFLALHGLPEGPLLLRDLGLARHGFVAASSEEHKLAAVRRLLATWPELPWVLVGDSGEKDPEIYARVVHENPGRVGAIYLREVGPPRRPWRRSQVEALALETAAAGVPMVLAPDTVAAAEHAAAHGWIDPADVVRVRADRRREEERPTPTEAAVRGEDGES
jgi:phosphatidate phosphatase APP1